MLPAINPSNRDVAHLMPGFQEITRLKDQLDFAEKDIVEEKRERARMKEQLRLQHDIIQRLYTRLDQVESQQAEESRIVGRLLNDTAVQQQLLSETQRAARSDRDTASDLRSTKEKLTSFSTMIREETQLLHQVNKQLKVDVANIQEYMNQMFNHEQSGQQAASGRFVTLETNINAAMDCIRSLQKSSGSLDKQLSVLQQDTHTRESEIASSLEQMGDCLKDAQNERRHLDERIDKDTSHMKNLLSEFKRDLQQENDLKDNERSTKEYNLFQSLEEMSQAVNVIEQRVVEEVQLSSREIESNTKARLGEVQGNLLLEQSARVTSEQMLRREVANVVNNLREHLTEQLTHSISAYQKDREKIQKSIRQLNESIGLIEKSSAAAKIGLEHIIQAEIKSRQGQNKMMSETLATTQSALGAVDDRREHDYTKIKEDISDSVDEKTEALQDQLTEINSSVSEMKNQYNTLREEVELTGDNISEVRVEFQAKIKESEERVLLQIHEQLDSLWAQVKDLTENSLTKNKEVDNKMRELEEAIVEEHEERISDFSEVAKSLETKLDKVTHTSEMSAMTQTCNEVSVTYLRVDERIGSVEKNTNILATDLTAKIEDINIKVVGVKDRIEFVENDSMNKLRQDINTIQSALEDKGIPQDESTRQVTTPILSNERTRSRNSFQQSPHHHETPVPQSPHRQKDPASPKPASPKTSPTQSKPSTPGHPSVNKPSQPTPSPTSPKGDLPQSPSNTPLKKQNSRKSLKSMRHAVEDDL